jgi:DNA primase
MSTAAPHHDPTALKRTLRLADVVEAYGIPLRASGRALVAPCPFHADGEHPNLHVYSEPDPAADHYHCFSCLAHGDVIDFLMRHAGLSFVEACARLAAAPPPRPRSAVRRRPPAPRRPERRRDQLSPDEQLVMDGAAALYQRRLWETPHALAYLRARGLPEDVVRACGLGYADGRALEAFLRDRDWIRLGERLGLLRRVAARDGKRPLREPMAGRIVVPEIRGGHAVWFIGRVVGEPGERPKYLTMPGERPVLGQERVLGHREAFVIEGVFGWLTGVAWGLPACCTCGTHLPNERLAFLLRADRVWGLLDPDRAGSGAAERLGTYLGDRWRPLWLPDPARRAAGGDGLLEIDDLALRPGGREQLEALLAAARGADDTREEDDHAH